MKWKDTRLWFGSKLFNATHLKLTINAEKFLAVNFAFDTFAQNYWKAHNQF